MEGGALEGRTGRNLAAELGDTELEKIGVDVTLPAAELAVIKNVPQLEERAMPLLAKTAQLFVGPGAETGTTTTNNIEAWGK
jgi:hypothetical protein